MVKQGRDPEPVTIVLKTYRAIPALLGGDKGFFNYFFMRHKSYLHIKI